MDLIPIDKEIQNKIYDDLFSPSLKEAGKALQNVIGLVTTITLPLLVAKDRRTNKILKKNLESLENKIKDIPEENRITIQPEIGVPILDKLTYYNNEMLSNMFLELLAKAANQNEISKVHPKYIKIIENLSEDEAIILNHIKNHSLYDIPFIEVQQVKKTDHSYFIIYQYISELGDISNLIFPNKINDYIENLKSLGIINIPEGKSLADKEYYTKLKNKDFILHLETQLSQNPDSTYEIKLKERKIEVSSLGKGFLNAIYK